MSSDQVAKLAATIEVLSGAVQFLLAERVSRQPGPAQGDLVHVLQRALSTPTRRAGTLLGKAALVQTDLALWMPIVATDLMDDVRRQLGRPPEGVTHIAPVQALSTTSKVAERGRGKALGEAVPRSEDGRSVA